MSWIPEEPSVPAEQSASAPVSLRFEDVSQDGRLVIEALPNALGRVVWGRLLADHPLLEAARKMGAVSILSRSAGEIGLGPISIARPLDVRCQYQLAHTVDEAGAVNRILLNMWGTAVGVAGHLYGPPPANAGQSIVVGRMFAEHVLTKPFGPPGERKVLAIETDGTRLVPPALYTWQSAEALLALPAGAIAIDAEPALDPTPICFGLDHTDANQHVNSLVYPRLFIEATLRRLAAHGRPTRLIARAVEIAFRKPCFAGERMRIAVRAFELGECAGITGVLIGEGEAGGPLDAARPRCVVRLLLGP